ncbi:fluoride efflux transporter FluC [Vreelandella sp. TE19]
MGQGLINVTLLALGAGLGGMGRFAVVNLAARRWGPGFPWGTLLVNTSGALAAGGLLGHYGFEHLSSSPLGLMLVAGLLGGYTTVSSLSLQTLSLWQNQRRLAAVANLMGTLALGLLMAGVGWWLSGGGVWQA